MIQLENAETDSAEVKQQPTYPSYFGYTFTGVTVTCGDQTETLSLENGVVTNAALNAAIGRVLAASDSADVTVTANYAENTETYTVTIVNQCENGEISRYTSEAFTVGEAVQLTAAQTRAYDGETCYFDHWVVNDESYASAVITLRPNKAEAYTVTAVYVKEPTAPQEPLVSIIGTEKETVNGKKKIAVTMTWSAPDNVTFRHAGFQYSTTDPEANAATTSINLQYSKLTSSTGAYTLHINRTGKEDRPIYIRAVLIYEDADGMEQTIHSEWQQLAWNNL